MNPLRIIDDEAVNAIHHAALRILSETGVILTHPEGRELLTGAGATRAGDRVRMPPDLVTAALAKPPDTVTLRGRDGRTATIGDGTLHWHNLGGARDVFDPATGQRREATIADLRQSAVILDALEHATTITPLYTPRDAPDHLVTLAMYRHTLPHTTKPIHGPGITNAKEARYAARMAEVIGSPGDGLALSVSPVSPLTFPDDSAGAIIEIARQGVPFSLLPSPTAGTTAPLSLAGALAQQHAENLAAIVLVQQIRPGLPVTYCGRLAVMDPRTGASIWGGVELGIVSAVTVQIGHRCGLPVNVYGFATNAYDYGIQSGYERALNALLPALAGADELSGIGELGAGVISSPAQLVLDNEIAASVKRARRGIQVDGDTLAVEVIHAVLDKGPGHRHFLGEKHTRRLLRAGEILPARLAERGSWEEWERGGRAGMVRRAQAEAARLLTEHQVPPLAREQERALNEIMQAADNDLAKRQ